MIYGKLTAGWSLRELGDEAGLGTEVKEMLIPIHFKRVTNLAA